MNRFTMLALCFTMLASGSALAAGQDHSAHQAHADHSAHAAAKSADNEFGALDANKDAH